MRRTCNAITFSHFSPYSSATAKHRAMNTSGQLLAGVLAKSFPAISALFLAAITALWLVAGVLHRVLAAPVDIDWIGGAGSWSVAGNWSPAQVPDNNTDTFNVRIDNGDTATNSAVTLDIDVIIDNLSVDSGDVLNLSSGRALALVGAGVVNSGRVNLSAGSSFLTDLTFEGDASLSGTGEVVMSHNPNNRILSDGSTVTQAAGHTIRGAGRVLDDTGGMVNRGSIIADQASHALVIDPSDAPGFGFDNQGTLRASGAGGLTFEAGTFTNTGQTIEIMARPGSVVHRLVSTSAVGRLWCFYTRSAGSDHSGVRAVWPFSLHLRSSPAG